MRTPRVRIGFPRVVRTVRAVLHTAPDTQDIDRIRTDRRRIPRYTAARTAPCC